MSLNLLRAGLDKSGKPVALSFKVVSQSITQRAFGLPKDTVDPFMIEPRWRLTTSRQPIINWSSKSRCCG